MDANKRQKLVDIGYRIESCCDLCTNAHLSPDGWGTCEIHTYTHLKHGDERDLSIHRTGWCDQFELSKAVEAELGGFADFLE